jgi:hypothetical protein
VHFDAVTHCQSDFTNRNHVCLMAPEAVAMSEAVAAESLPLGFELSAQRSPTFTSIQIGGNAVGNAIA